MSYDIIDSYSVFFAYTDIFLRHQRSRMIVNIESLADQEKHKLREKLEEAIKNTMREKGLALYKPHRMSGIRILDIALDQENCKC